MKTTIYVIDVRDVVCPSCYNEIPIKDIDNADYDHTEKRFTRCTLKCWYCNEKLELRSV